MRGIIQELIEAVELDNEEPAEPSANALFPLTIRSTSQS
jgi:hypothetical protein